MNGIAGPLVRCCAQEVITAHVVARDFELRDRLIDEYAESHGDALLNVVYAFIHDNVVRPVQPETAEQAFWFVLHSLGLLIDAVSEATGADSCDVALTLARDLALDHEAMAPDSDPAMWEREDTAIQAAQTCLVSHMLVRRGHMPLGIQQALDLDGMSTVVSVLGDFVWVLISVYRDELGDAALICGLLDGVALVLAVTARTHDMALSDLVSGYFGHLVANDDSAAI